MLRLSTSPLYPTVALLLLLLLAASSPSVSRASSLHDVEEWRGAVLDLDDGNFAVNLANREVVVEFYAPWCSLCVAFAPTYEAWAQQSYQQASGVSRVAIARVNCELNPDVASRQRVVGYPSVRLYRDGEVVDEYRGERTVDALHAWLAIYSKQASQSGQHKAKGTRAPAAAVSSQQPSIKEQQDASGEPEATPADDSKPRPLRRLLSSLLSDYSLISEELSSLDNIAKLTTALLDAPRHLFRSHPIMCLTAVWAIGLFQGVFAGILFAVRR